MNICAQICKFIYKALKLPIYFYIEKKLKTQPYPHVFVALAKNSLL